LASVNQAKAAALKQLQRATEQCEAAHTPILQLTKVEAYHLIGKIRERENRIKDALSSYKKAMQCLVPIKK